MVLDDVANDAGLVVELAAPFDAEALGHRDLHVLDVVPVPDRLEERVREAEVEEVLHRFLAEEVVDAEDARLVEDAAQQLVQRPGRIEIVSERLLDNDPGVRRAARLAQALDHGREHARRNREVVRGPRAPSSSRRSCVNVLGSS